MTTARPYAIRIVSAMIAGSLIGIAVGELYTTITDFDTCKTLAMLIVGFLLFNVAVLSDNYPAATVSLVCFLITMLFTLLINQSSESLFLPLTALCIAVQLFVCDKTLKKFTKRQSPQS